ncbi:MAG: Nif3-like dinuclear metal center hexameric protein [Zoogloeaceae bacterium]|nr:Nif3-like dinuclear metal center hexameric protein [Zoogloeaceae bacterium]MCK6384472.1 Nif3-like dinuclear metal center hexameric protein [Rhodocyclaceae bacterium]
MDRNELAAHLDVLLECGRFRDYCPNGLQVEGRPEVRRLVCGVSASLALIEAARAAGADAVLVHHGWFWRNEDSRVTGVRRARLKTLLENDISLFAYHLPLDAHAELGNNARLGALMGWTAEGRFAEQDVGFLGRTEGTAGELADRLSLALGRRPLLVGDGARPVKRIAWCSGGAQGHFEQAIAAGADLYVSGEISEQTTHLARESGVPYIAAGHHATERYGVQALGAHLSERFGIECRYVEIDNPA